jgi:hypothetical protein
LSNRGKITEQELRDTLLNQINEIDVVKSDIEGMKENIDSALLINAVVDQSAKKIGDLNNLTTDTRTDLVTALNSTETKVKSLSQLPNEYEWSANAGQLDYTLPSGASYDPNVKWFRVEVGGAPLAPSMVNKVSTTQFKLLIPPSLIYAGMKVVARWAQPLVAGGGNGNGNAGIHHASHELGGTDEIDITKLKGYTTYVFGKIGDLSALQTTSKTSLVSSVNELLTKINANKTDVITVSDIVGNLGSLQTGIQSSIVDAINEVARSVQDSPTNIGNLVDLRTDNKNNIVGAINDNNSKISVLSGFSSDAITPTYNELGQLTSVEETSGTTTITSTSINYNADGTVNYVVETINGRTMKSTLVYDNNGNLANVVKEVI